jgi:hypothetical protein
MIISSVVCNTNRRIMGYEETVHFTGQHFKNRAVVLWMCVFMQLNFQNVREFCIFCKFHHTCKERLGDGLTGLRFVKISGMFKILQWNAMLRKTPTLKIARSSPRNSVFMCQKLIIEVKYIGIILNPHLMDLVVF